MTHKTPGQIAQHILGLDHPTGGHVSIHADDLVSLLSRAIEADRAQRDEAQMLENVRLYAEERAAHARLPLLNTVGSARIASDLFQILGLPYPHPEDLEEVEP